MLGESRKIVDGHNEQELERLAVLQVCFQHFLAFIIGELRLYKPNEEVIHSQKVSAEEGKKRG
jgi:hypothetical protein